MSLSTSKSLLVVVGNAALELVRNAPAPLIPRLAARAKELIDLSNRPPRELPIALRGLRVETPDDDGPVNEFREIFAQATVSYSFQPYAEFLEIVLPAEILAMPDSLANLIPSVRNILVKIDSHGGCARTAFKIIDALEGKNVRVEIGRIAASAAALIAQAGKHRVIAHDGHMVLHPSKDAAYTHAGNLRKLADELDRDTAAMTEFLMRRTQQPRETVEAWLSGPDVWFDARQALAANLVDEIAPN